MANQRKYNPNTHPRTEIRRMVIQLRTTHPEWTLIQIGEEVGRTRERIRQILRSEGMEARSSKAAYERQPFYAKKGQPCKHCKRPVSYALKSPYKDYPTRMVGHYPTFCTANCRKEYYFPTQTCDYCKQSFTIRRGDLQRRKISSNRIYCSKPCRSRGYWETVKNGTTNIYGYSIRQNRGGRQRNNNNDNSN